MEEVIILNIETSGDVFSIAISNKNFIIETIEIADKNKHSELIASETDRILKKNNITINNLKAVAISKGPGSYTGLRIGTSFAKALCYSLKIPLITISTLKILANSFLLKNNTKNFSYLCPLIDAKKMDVYFALFDSNLNYIIYDTDATITNEFFSNLPCGNISFFGSGSNKISEFVKHEKNLTIFQNVYQTAAAMPDLAWNDFITNNFADIKTFEPFYIREFIPNLFKKK
ncbi:MAG: tRNA (adenosine(37)-N6)-threonylcarbamoyltransferase complex dimerization subunit type 1 TsaB [Bacteroidales bacterium]|nr:tRNA (adenosine(37)-N6)-threonylcarbamoyltransferase complex dimerization subunit type 1 TsaB [Bacteroidales bacterium]